MCIAGDMERVYEIAPGEIVWRRTDYTGALADPLSVFRAEDSNTHRHMTEFVGLDLEMAIEEHYDEVIDTLDSLFLNIFKGLKSKFAREIDVISKQFPCEEFLFLDETLRLPFTEGTKMLQEAGATDSEGNPIDVMADMRWVQLLKQRDEWS